MTGQRPARVPIVAAGGPWTSSPAVFTKGSAEEFQRSLSRLADALITLENSGHLDLVRAQGPAGKPAGPAALRLRAAMDDVWLRYPLVKAVGERLAAAMASDLPGEAGHLLGPHAVTLPDGTTTSAVSLVAELQRQTEGVADEAAILAQAGLEALSRLEAAGPRLLELRARAAAIGAMGDRVLTSAFESVVHEQKALAHDLFRPTTDLERAMDEAGLCLDDLERVGDSLPKRMVGARSALAELEELIRIGAEEAATAIDKIREPEGLRAPIDSERLDRGERALRPWLAQIDRHVETGQWRTADEGLTRWSREAAALRIEAIQICEANEAPVGARKELRGLLDSYRAMAGAMGMAEDPLLSRLYEEACSALYEAPCDLPAADRKVRIFLDALNGRPPSEAR
ncbi:MAG: hypothetical protein M3450_08555 [Actinomycetota bacterium]|nr:hypothetical protein [Actinomycetota bacterium]